MLFGCYDLGSLILIFLINASMNFFGLLMERLNPPARLQVREPNLLQLCCVAPYFPALTRQWASSLTCGRMLDCIQPTSDSLSSRFASSQSRSFQVDWSPFVFGCVAGLGPWIVIGLYFFGGGNYGQIPGYVPPRTPHAKSKPMCHILRSTF